MYNRIDPIEKWLSYGWLNKDRMFLQPIDQIGSTVEISAIEFYVKLQDMTSRVTTWHISTTKLPHCKSSPVL